MCKHSAPSPIIIIIIDTPSPTDQAAAHIPSHHPWRRWETPAAAAAAAAAAAGLLVGCGYLDLWVPWCCCLGPRDWGGGGFCDLVGGGGRVDAGVVAGGSGAAAVDGDGGYFGVGVGAGAGVGDGGRSSDRAHVECD